MTVSENVSLIEAGCTKLQWLLNVLPDIPECLVWTVWLNHSLRVMCHEFLYPSARVTSIGSSFEDVFPVYDNVLTYEPDEFICTRARKTDCIVMMFTISHFFESSEAWDIFIRKVWSAEVKMICVAYWKPESVFAMSRFSLHAPNPVSFGSTLRVQIAPDATTHESWCVVEEALDESMNKLGLVEHPAIVRLTTHGHSLHPDYAKLAAKLRIRCFTR
jgi:hypothetical protein